MKCLSLILIVTVLIVCQSIRNMSFYMGQQWHVNYAQQVFLERCSREINHWTCSLGPWGVEELLIEP